MKFDTGLAPPVTAVHNLRFTRTGVYAEYLLCGIPYYLQSTKRRYDAARAHRTLIRELPSGILLYGLSAPEDQHQLLRAMLAEHRHHAAWVAACRQAQHTIAAKAPRTRIYWLSIPIDAGRAGRTPTGQATKLKDWILGRDKDSDDSIEAYLRLAADIAAAIPARFAPQPVTPAMIAWHWCHNIARGTIHDPLARHATGITNLTAAHFPTAIFDDRKILRVHSPNGAFPDSHQVILPVTHIPKEGIAFPGSEFLMALDDFATGAVVDWGTYLIARNTELELARNDRAKANIDDQFTQRRDTRDGDAELRQTRCQLSEYTRLIKRTPAERALEATFYLAVGAPDEPTLHHTVKRLREELDDAGQIVVRHQRGAQAALWKAFNPGGELGAYTAQFSHPTTGDKWSKFVPMTSTRLGNTSGLLLAVNKANAHNGLVLLDLEGTARRNRNPCLVICGSPGYGKSYAAKRIISAQLDRGAQAFVVDPGTEWARAMAARPGAVIVDLANSKVGIDPLRVFPHAVAGGYWCDYLLPMLGIASDTTEAAQLRTLLQPARRAALGITSTTALIAHLQAIQKVADPETVALADDLRPTLAKLQSWATLDYCAAIFDDTLRTPDLSTVDVSVWLTGSLELPTADEVHAEHLYAGLSQRKRASAAIYAMIVRLARLAFFANQSRFGVIVLEEAAGFLNSDAGAADAHMVSRQARKHYTGMVIITQNPIRDLARMGDEFLTQKLIMRFEDERLSTDVLAWAGINPAEYPDVVTHFTEPSTEQGQGFFVDEFRRVGPVQVIAETNPTLAAAFDTTPGQR
jgi:hypothetical protein